jgi:hypothetical protein
MTHGGRRPGAGRKPGARALVTRTKAEGVLATVDEATLWQRLLHSRNERILFEALKYLTDRRDGKPIQSTQVEGHLGLSVEEIMQRLHEGRKRNALAGCKAARRLIQT